MQPCSLLSLATAVPPYVIEQADAKALGARGVRRQEALFDRLSGVFDNAGIARRHIVAPPEWYMTEHGWQERNAVYLDAAEAMFIDAAAAAIEQSRLDARPRSTASSPSRRPASPRRAWKRAGRRLGLRDNVRRVPVFGLGCAGGVNGLSLAARLAAAEPGSHLAVRHRRDLLDLDPPRQRRPGRSRRDGLVRRRRRRGGGHQRRAQHRTDHRLRREALARYPSDHGLGRRRPRTCRSCSTGRSRRSSSRSWPPRSMGSARRLGITRGAIDRFCCHPGGVKVIDAIETALDCARRAQPRARSAARYRQHERADRVVRPRTPAGARAARPGDDDRLRTGLHLRRTDARSRRDLNIAILALVTRSGLASCGCANRNTARLIAQARAKCAGPLSADRRPPHRLAARLWWFAPSPPDRRLLARAVRPHRARRASGSLVRSARAGRRASSSSPARRWSAGPVPLRHPPQLLWS